MAEKEAANAQHKPPDYEWRMAAYHKTKKKKERKKERKKRKWQEREEREAAKQLLHSKLGT